MGLDIPVVPLELPAYSRKENWGASETFYPWCARCCAGTPPQPGERPARWRARARAQCNLLGPTALGFRCRDDVTEVTAC
jgi:light-independent protochlorophyllide reductase subunit B